MGKLIFGLIFLHFSTAIHSFFHHNLLSKDYLCSKYSPCVEYEIWNFPRGVPCVVVTAKCKRSCSESFCDEEQTKTWQTITQELYIWEDSKKVTVKKVPIGCVCDSADNYNRYPAILASSPRDYQIVN